MSQEREPEHKVNIVTPMCVHIATATNGVELMVMVLLLPVSVLWASWCGVVAADVVAQNMFYVQRLVIVYNIRRRPMPWYGRMLVGNRCLFSWWPSFSDERGKFVMCADVTSYYCYHEYDFILLTQVARRSQ